jgi:hypothetical protein
MHLKIGFYAHLKNGVAEGEGVDLLHQIAIEAGFSYELAILGTPGNCSATYDWGPCPANYGVFFFDALKHLDVLGPWWSKRSHREAVHDFGHGWVDNSMTIFTLAEIQNSEIDWLNWAHPFTGDAWMLLLLTCVLTGISMFLFEGCQGVDVKTLKDSKTDNHARAHELALAGSSAAKAVESAFEGMMTGGGGSATTTVAGTLVSFSFGFITVIVLAAYTANTAAFLTQRAGGVSMLLKTTDDLQASKLPLCAFSSDGIMEEMVRARFPGVELLTSSLLDDEENGVIESLTANIRAGNCIAAATFKVSLNTLEGKQGNCDIRYVGAGANAFDTLVLVRMVTNIWNPSRRGGALLSAGRTLHWIVPRLSTTRMTRGGPSASGRRGWPRRACCKMGLS